jgi:FKBP-type peptidyl-prolyl cis-trans isomerase
MFVLCAFFTFALAGISSLTSDGKVTKKILREGSGRRPEENEKVIIHYTGSLTDGTVFDSSRNRTPFQFTIGRGVISGWSIGVRSMTLGELSNFTIGHDYGYGAKGYPPVIPAEATLNFEIELLAIGD